MNHINPACNAVKCWVRVLIGHMQSARDKLLNGGAAGGGNLPILERLTSNRFPEVLCGMHD